MSPRLVQLPEKRLVGTCLPMSLSENRTRELWRRFMPRRHEAGDAGELFAVQVYDPGYFDRFDPTRVFDKWAAVQQREADVVPEGMDLLTIPAGTYAVFDYRGSSSDTRIFDHIFRAWLPASGYRLDNRPHFELLGKKYRNNDTGSEEEIWIPVNVGAVSGKV
ncbi:MAG: AraC family transcriptional regulator [Flaviaesturariibacter sp.]|nr:AraC family transcriptional regulator [Flaviaesturariibacter sp.]